jgi:N-formylglutamate deformylase
VFSLELPVFQLTRGQSPLIVSIPHCGEHLPAWLAPRLSVAGRALQDTDWYLTHLYDFLQEMDVTVIAATHARYVVDLNRPPDDTSLYPGQNTTGLCPLTTFHEDAVYIAGAEPNAQEILVRRDAYWRPYHDALAQELERIRQRHGYAVLWDAHSIRSHVPRFFAGELPHLNLGTADGQSCDVSLTEAMLQTVQDGLSPYSWVVNGRFKGGYITRHYGCPEQGVHAVQMEMAMRTYMNEDPPWVWDAEKARPAQRLLQSLMAALKQWRPDTNSPSNVLLL